MTQDDVRRIEQAIGRSLPAAVRQFFLNYPPELRSTARDLGPTPDGEPYLECPADNELCDSADAIIALNDPQSGMLLGDAANMLIVGQGECGELYWVALDDAHGVVSRLEAGMEPEFSDRLADSLEIFARGLIESYRAG
jgi:hypothetical protein